MKKQMQLVRCTVNGREVEEYVDVRESLLDMLRNRLGLTSVKKGCEVGECGACTVIIDGETIDSCIYLAVWAEGKKYPYTGRSGEKRRTYQDSGGIYRRRCHTVRFLHSRIYHVCHCFTGTWREIIKRCDSETYGRKSLPLHRL